MTAVKSLISELAKRGVVARWEGTGGNCMAVVVYFGPVLADGQHTYEIMVTDRDDVFTPSDHNSDDEVYGFHAGFYAYEVGYNRLCDDVVLYQTADDVEALAPEVMACADAVQFAVQRVEEADAGREWEMSW